MTKGTVRDVYIKYLEHNPSAAPRFHAWVDPTAPSPSPPLSEPAPSSSRSSGPKPSVPKKSWRNTSHIVEAKMSDDIERDGRKEALINKITKEIGEHRSLGKKMSTTKAIAQFQPEIDALGASIKPGMINWRLREGYIGKSAPKRR